MVWHPTTFSALGDRQITAWVFLFLHISPYAVTSCSDMLRQCLASPINGFNRTVNSEIFNEHIPCPVVVPPCRLWASSVWLTNLSGVTEATAGQ